VGPGLGLETRPDGSVLVTAAGPGRWGAAGAGVVLAGGLLTAVPGGAGTALGLALIGPLALAALLAAVALVRHRDWILFDPRAREIVSRQGATSILRAARVLPFDEIAGIRVGDGLAVDLVRGGGPPWRLGVARSAGERDRLVAALARVGGWGVLHEAPGAVSAPA
jgi:hypothetical protein